MNTEQSPAEAEVLFGRSDEGGHMQSLLSTIAHLSNHLELDLQLTSFRQQHESVSMAQVIKEQCVDKKMRAAAHETQKESQRDIYTLSSQNSELQLQALRWRKKTAILRLKISSSEETVRQLQDNQDVLQRALHEVLADKLDMQKLNNELGKKLEVALKQLQDQRDFGQKQQQEFERCRHSNEEFLQRERDELLQQLEGTQLLLSNATKKIDEMGAKLSNERVAAEATSKSIMVLKEQLENLHCKLLTAEESASASESKKKLAEERMKIAEQALTAWKQLEDDRKQLLHEQGQQLAELQKVGGLGDI
jgi:hypothetical protein